MLSDTHLRMARAAGQLDFLHPVTGNPLELLPEQWQPHSVDLRLGDVGPGWSSCWSEGDGPKVWTLHPFRFALASTFEVVTLGPHLGGLVHGRSSVARRGLQVEAAGLVDAGFSGQITLELINFGPDPIRLIEGERLCQLTVHRIEGPVNRPYGSDGLGSSFQGQTGPTPAPPRPGVDR